MLQYPLPATHDLRLVSVITFAEKDYLNCKPIIMPQHPLPVTHVLLHRDQTDILTWKESFIWLWFINMFTIQRKFLKN